MDSDNIYTAKYANISKVLSDKKLFGKIKSYTLEKATKIKGITNYDGSDVVASCLYDNDDSTRINIIQYFFTDTSTLTNDKDNNYNADNHKGEITIAFSNLTKEISFVRSIEKELKSGDDDLTSQVTDWGDLANDNSYMRVYKLNDDGSKTTYLDCIKTQSIYASSDASLSDFSLGVDYIVHGDMNNSYTSNQEFTFNDVSVKLVDGSNVTVNCTLKIEFSGNKLSVKYEAQVV